MVSFVVKNNVESVIVDNPLAQAATTLNVTTGDGAEFPSTFPFLITLWDESTYPDPTDDSEMEIIKCTGRSIDALTIVRAQEGTTDVAHASGGRVAMLITAGIFNDSTNGITTKLDGIESLADVTSTHETSHTDVLVDGDINVTVAGALGSDDNYVTDAEKVVIGNTSGANTGDQTLPTDATLEFTDVITNNVSNTKHGFVPKATDVAGQFLKSDGTWGVTAGGGDMEAVTYDPTSIIGDVFAMDNMVEGVTTKILTGTERTLLGNTSGANTGDQIASGVTNTPAGDIAATNVQDAINELDTEKTTLTEVKADSDIADLILQSDFIDYTDSPMIVTGGEISVGTNAGTFKVAALTALIRKTDSAIGELAYVTKTEEDNIAIPLSCTNYYVVVNYNGGAPTVSLITDLQNFNNNIPIGSVMKDALNVVHFISGCYRLQGGVAKLHYRAFELYNLYLASGNTIAYSGTNNFTMTTGVMYEGINRLTQSAYNSATNTFNSIQNDNAGGWTENALNAIDYTHYDLADGSGNLGLIGIAKYGCHWVYRHAGECGHVYVLYGTDSYSLAGAEVAKVPNGPDHLTNFGCLIGKIIAPQAGGSFTIQMVTDTTFTGVSIANHDDLGGLNDGDYKHLTATEKTLFDTLDSGADVTANNAPQAHETSHESGGSDELDFDQLADGTTYKKLLATERTKLTGIETAADVTDEVNIASSIAGVADKATPIDADSIGIIDSAAANVLKELTWANVKATLKTYFDTLYNQYVHPNHSGDVTSNGDGATTIAVGAIDVAMHSATGTPGATNYYRGDNTWNTPIGSGDMTKAVYDSDDDGVIASAQLDTGIALCNGSRAMTGNIDMGGNNVVNCSKLVATGDASQFDIYGGENHAGSIACFGKSHATTAYRGDIRFYVPDAAGNIDKLVMTINGLTDTPNLELYWDLDMNSKAITSVLDPTSAQDAATMNYVDTRTKNVVVKVIADDTALATGDGKTHFTIPIELNGMNLISVGAHVYTVSSSGLPNFQIHNLTDVSDMLSTAITIDATELDSKDATTAAVINAAEDDVVTGDVIRFDCDAAGTGTKGMEIRMGFRLP